MQYSIQANWQVALGIVLVGTVLTLHGEPPACADTLDGLKAGAHRCTLNPSKGGTTSKATSLLLVAGPR